MNVIIDVKIVKQNCCHLVKTEKKDNQNKKCCIQSRRNLLSESEINNINVIANIYSHLLIPYIQIITEKPAFSSKGFSNTFRLLQKRLQNHKLKVTIMGLSNDNNNVDLKSSLEFDMGKVIKRLLILIENENAIKQLSHLIVCDNKGAFRTLITRVSPLLLFLYNFVIQNMHEKNFKDFMNYDVKMILSKILQNHYQSLSNRIEEIFVKPVVISDIQILKYYAGYVKNGKNCLRIIRNIECKHTKGNLYFIFSYHNSSNLFILNSSNNSIRACVS